MHSNKHFCCYVDLSIISINSSLSLKYLHVIDKDIFRSSSNQCSFSNCHCFVMFFQGFLRPHLKAAGVIPSVADARNAKNARQSEQCRHQVLWLTACVKIPNLCMTLGRYALALKNLITILLAVTNLNSFMANVLNFQPVQWQPPQGKLFS